MRPLVKCLAALTLVLVLLVGGCTERGTSVSAQETTTNSRVVVEKIAGDEAFKSGKGAANNGLYRVDIPEDNTTCYLYHDDSDGRVVGGAGGLDCT